MDALKTEDTAEAEKRLRGMLTELAEQDDDDLPARALWNAYGFSEGAHRSLTHRRADFAHAEDYSTDTIEARENVAVRELVERLHRNTKQRRFMHLVNAEVVDNQLTMIATLAEFADVPRVQADISRPRQDEHSPLSAVIYHEPELGKDCSDSWLLLTVRFLGELRPNRVNFLQSTNLADLVMKNADVSPVKQVNPNSADPLMKMVIAGYGDVDTNQPSNRRYGASEADIHSALVKHASNCFYMVTWD
jgi:hypothetical protein